MGLKATHKNFYIKSLLLSLISLRDLINPLPINMVRLFSKGIAYFALCIPTASTSFKEDKWSSISPPIIIKVVEDPVFRPIFHSNVQAQPKWHQCSSQ